MFITCIHSFGIVLLALIGERIRDYVRSRGPHFWDAIGFLMIGVAVMALLLAVLHGVEAALWAGAYLSLGALDTPAEAMLFSVDCYKPPIGKIRSSDKVTAAS